ncbi:MAG: TIGR03088 family PEP-CTERM/XrtA system glycosyltransferase [Rhodocyclaceae bacterium]|jgi:sugar transferase (PEP-CTERM/EpsH1 system associated)|nr:TIGR03088 family PEP-CTERM/XrtA system glycosyltransferase [Rhodocyclaceae bacterium]MBK9311893.1 TIGR03088 family PEP-CTERM/XrtA system glycosyltransferase [Rhodocyclaceae bacterium]MBK9956755.1 TIGR03088 family PEP-CTERM/XrtA system glycosyltransferase [Rhodocyclaceae bacterium]
MRADARPLVVHVMYRFDVGGLENGVVNLINRMPADAYRHAVLALTEVTDFRRRIARDDVEFISLAKPPGHLWWLYPRLFRLFRQLRPAIVHSRNLAALEVAVPAWAAGVPVRIHGEHGRDVGDLKGLNKTYQWLRRLYNPFVTHFIALSRDLENYLLDPVGIARRKVTQIYNGVDAERFHPADGLPIIDGCPFRRPQHWLVGTVGRMQTVKDQTLLARAFVRALEREPALRQRLRLVMVGEGPLRAQAQEMLDAAGVADLAWLPGERHDVPDILRGLDCFVLPSLAEGISNTILEAMASGLPVIATRVGGNPELVLEGETGRLVPVGDVEALASALIDDAHAPEADRAAGLAGRWQVERRFSMDSMVAAYRGLYDELLAIRKPV